MHCHILDHEDRGMMKAFGIFEAGDARLLGGGPLAIPGFAHKSNLQPKKAPNDWKPVSWELPDSTGKLIRSADFKGKPILLILHKGLGCVHCTEQLRELAKHDKEIRALGLSIIAVGPEAVMPQEARFYAEKHGLHFPLLGDPSHKTYANLGCLDKSGRPSHGVFLLDREFLVQWHSISDDPIIDIAMLIREARRMIEKSNNRKLMP
jgi:peroxiredoxin